MKKFCSGVFVSYLLAAITVATAFYLISLPWLNPQ